MCRYKYPRLTVEEWSIERVCTDKMLQTKATESIIRAPRLNGINEKKTLSKLVCVEKCIAVNEYISCS